MYLYLIISYFHACNQFMYYYEHQSFLNAYDAVILGDGSFRFCKSLIEELLQLGDDVARGNKAVKQ